jgi:formylglycine-generating enzyme required for sulfatase activity
MKKLYTMGVAFAMAAGTLLFAATSCGPNIGPEPTDAIKVESVSLDEPTATITVGLTKTLVATVLPADAADKSYTWKSSNETIATVAEGVVTAVAVGEATITVTTTEGSKTADCVVTVVEDTKLVESIEFDITEKTLPLAGEATIVPTVLPADATDATLTWESDNEEVATVVDGVVTVVGEGMANIKATAKDGSDVEQTCTVTVIPFVKVETGTFQMGVEGPLLNGPIHDVTISTFYMGIHEVTQEEWVAVMGNNPAGNQSGEANLPMENVAWNTVAEFIAALNEATGLEYRLPTEAEWEYAAGGGNLLEGFTYSGSDVCGDVAWYNDFTEPIGVTKPVCTKQPNGVGIYDMTGNVYEWCNDWYVRGYPAEPQTDPQGPESGTFKIARGGDVWAWDSGCDIKGRTSYTPDVQNPGIGFRLVLQSM